MSWKTYYDMAADIQRLLVKCGREYDYIFGVPRFGLIPAAMYSANTGIPMLLDESKIKESGRVLIIDDSWHRGRTMKNLSEKHGHNSITYAVVYGRDEQPAWIISAVNLNDGRLFEWEMFSSQKVSYDIDGVLCPDVPKGANYAEYLASAPMMCGPIIPCKAIITSRHENYRAITEKWLKDNGVEYQYLIMSKRNNPRDRKINAPRDKAAACKKIGVSIFLESSDWMAEGMAKLGITTISLKSKRMFRAGRKSKRKKK